MAASHTGVPGSHLPCEHQLGIQLHAHRRPDRLHMPMTLLKAHGLCAGACPVEYWVPMYAIADVQEACTTIAPDGSYPLFSAGSNHQCNGHKMESPRFWLGAAGLTLMCVLMHRGLRVRTLLGL